MSDVLYMHAAMLLSMHTDRRVTGSNHVVSRSVPHVNRAKCTHPMRTAQTSCRRPDLGKHLYRFGN